MADITERIVIPEVPRVLDGQELYVYIPKVAIFDLNIEKGTGNVLVQTTDQAHSFKVMTDGRAKRTVYDVREPGGVEQPAVASAAHGADGRGGTESA